ncbi:single-stranded DNA-binding protein [Actinomyces radicidentis]|uniref:single-stranded DNA-binding protein n=1 Tax=Actinomyces radicidentis TaxID=111015 RepID=UPI0028E52DCF|nr:single-stranded DNA-binding protein [Actinomyces radicidentis]
MTRQPELTVQAVLGTNPVLSHVGEDKRPFCRFRAATTPSVRTSDGGWRDGETVWFTAKAWGALAENLAFSLHKGEPVLLHGRLGQETWTGERGESTSNVLTLITAGHDLSRGYSRYTRSGDAAASGSAPSAASADGASGAPDATGAQGSSGLAQEHWETAVPGTDGPGAEEPAATDGTDTDGLEGAASEQDAPPYLLADLEEGISLPA